MNREEIMKILPHRDAMLLLDSAERDGEYAVGSLYIKGDEWFLQGHFPGNPIVPGVIQCEIMAQSICVLMEEQMAQGKLPVYTGLNKVKFKNPVKPGDTFTTRCRIVKSKGPFYFAEGQGFVGDRLCVQGEFSFAVTDKVTAAGKAAAADKVTESDKAAESDKVTE